MPLATQRILFLDIDGVVLPLSQPARRRYEDYEPDRIPVSLRLLMDFLNQKTEIQIVLSSSWRMDNRFRHAQELLPAQLRYRMIGSTPVINNGRDRSEECTAWIASNFPDAAFAAIDDCSQLFPTNPRWLVLVDCRIGVNEAAIDSLHKILYS